MNAANAVTVTRILLIPVFLVLLFSRVPYGDMIAVAVFAIAAGTDKLDGYLARSRNAVTAAGIFLDPLADKLLISSALIALVSLERLEAWVAMVIIGREFAVSGLRLVGIAQGVSIPASHLGKVKTVSQTVAVLFLLVSHTSLPYYRQAEDVLIYTAVALTLASGIEYFFNARALLQPTAKPVRPVSPPGEDATLPAANTAQECGRDDARE
jgi:CDP-diacylglycerol--glycerol-3-phosphate 3-phosphatidyltransferase